MNKVRYNLTRVWTLPILSAQTPISPFERTRHDHASGVAEDYVETIAELISINGYC
jgi:hypothetical protein